MERYEIDDMKANLQSYLESNGIDTSRLFRCINPEHQDNNASMKYFDDHKVFCFGCGESYDLVDCISIMEHLEPKEAFKEAINRYCHNYSPTKTNYVPKAITKPKTEKIDIDYSEFYKQWHENYKNNKQAQNYIKNRGISEDIAERFKLGYNTFSIKLKDKTYRFTFNAVVIPASKYCFSARNLDNTNKLRYYKPTGCNADLFNIEAITNDKPYCVITEGEFDCLSFETIGVNAAALCSAYNINKFFTMQKPFKTFILALDNDDIGIKQRKKLIDYFEKNNYPYVIFNNCNYKDANLALTQDRNKFEQEITTICDDIIQKEKRKQKLHNAEM